MAIDPTLAFATLAYATRTNATIAKPTGVVDGDFLLAGIYVEGDIAVTAPSGWTLIANVDHVTVAMDLWLYYKRASGEGASWLWTHSSAPSSGWVWRLTGVVASGDPENATRSVNDQGGSATVTWNSITTATDGALVIALCSQYDTAGRFSGSTLTERLDMDDLFVSADVQATAGATGNKTATSSESASYQSAVLLALKPAAAGRTTKNLNPWPLGMNIGAHIGMPGSSA